MQRFFRWQLRHRLLFLVAVVLPLCGLFGVFAAKVKPDYSVEQFFPVYSEERATYDRFKESFPHEDTRALVVIESDDLFTLETLERIGALEEALAELPHVQSVRGPRSQRDITGDLLSVELSKLFPDDLDADELEERKRVATTDPLFAWRLANPSGTAMGIEIVLEPDAAGTDAGRQEFTRAADELLASHDGQERLTLSGLPVIRSRFAHKVGEDLGLLVPLALVVALLFLYLAYQSLVTVLAGLVTMAASLVWAQGVQGLLGHSITIVSSILPILVIIISMADTVHIVNEFFHQRREGLDKEAALARAMSLAAGPCLATEIVIAAGFLSLLAVNIVALWQFGLSAAGAMMVTWLAQVTVLPLVLSLSRGGVSDGKPSREPLAFRVFGGVIRWIGVQVTEHRGRVLLVGAAVVGLGAAAATQVTRLSYVFDDLAPGSDFEQEIRRAESAFGGMVPVALFVESAAHESAENPMLEPEVLALLERGEALLEGFDDIEQATSLATYLRKANRTFLGPEEGDSLPATRALAAQELVFIDDGDMLADVLSFDRRTAVVMAQARDAGSIEFASMFEDIEAWLAAERARFDTEGMPPVRIGVTGQLQLFHQVNDSLTGGLFRSFGGALLLTVLVMSLVLASWRLGLLGIVPNMIPSILAVAFMVAAGITLRLSTVVVFSIILVIAADDTIQYLARFRRYYLQAMREADPEPHRRAVLDSLREAGLPMFVTTCAVTAGFLTLTLSQFAGLADMGLLIGVILFAAVFADLFIGPALLMTVKPRLRVGR